MGLILCGEKNQKQIELLQLGRAGSGWRSIWRSCRQRRCWRPGCMRQYGWREDLQLCDVAVQLAEDAEVVAADE